MRTRSNREPVQVWKVPLAQPPEVVSACRQLLSPEEIRRAGAFRFDRAHRSYIVAHGALRLILARSLAEAGVPTRKAAAALRFGQGARGKPHLIAEADPGVAPLQAPAQFSLSHCEDLALVAVLAGAAEEESPTGAQGQTGGVGVDVERTRPLSDLGAIRQRYFSGEEREYLAAAVAEGPLGSSRAFLRLWTRREAAAKASGQDLQAALTRVKIPVYSPGAGTALDGLGGVSGRWWLTDLALDAEHLGALCARGAPREVALFDFLPSQFL